MIAKKNPGLATVEPLSRFCPLKLPQSPGRSHQGNEEKRQKARAQSVGIKAPGAAEEQEPSCDLPQRMHTLRLTWSFFNGRVVQAGVTLYFTYCLPRSGGGFEPHSPCAAAASTRPCRANCNCCCCGGSNHIESNVIITVPLTFQPIRLVLRLE